MCIFESGTVKSDCPVQIFRKMMKYLKITLLVLLFFLEILKKKKKNSEKKDLKMTRQLVIFRAFLFYFSSPDPRSEKKNPVNQLIKKIWPLS